MTSTTKKSSAEPLAAMLQKPAEVPAPKTTKIDLTELEKAIEARVKDKAASTARYVTFFGDGKLHYNHSTVCYHSLPDAASSAAKKDGGIAVVFQGYGGFEKGDRWREATEADLYTNIPIPFVMADEGHYNEVSLEWLKCLLDPEGPFKALLPHLLDNTPEAVQKRRAFIFPDVSSIPPRLTWCFAIASRLGYANPRVVWRYLHMRAKGLDSRTSLLIAGGFEHHVKNGEISGQIIKSYTSGFLGVDVTAYAGRMLTSTPVVDPPLRNNSYSTYGSSEVFKSGSMDLKKLTFDNWQEVIEYTQARGREQSGAEKKAA